MKKIEYDLSLSNDNITINRVDELDHFMKTYYNEEYEKMNKIYRFYNPLFGILAFISIPIQAFCIQYNFILGLISSVLTFVILISMYIYSDIKPRQMKKDVFTNIYENFKFIVTDVEYPVLARPIKLNNQHYYYYEFITSFTKDHRIRLKNSIEEAVVDNERNLANYKDVMTYLEGVKVK